MLIVSISVYAVDTFTAINLLAFDRWAGSISPKVDLHISRWIFAGCIILSFILLAYRWLRAVRVMRQGGVAKSYLDPLAVRIQSIRMGKTGRGWRRFLVFAELTKSRKGADYVALFAYFSFEAWLRICFADGPRQVLNAITLYSVMEANLLPQGDHAGDKNTSPVVQFFLNIGVLANSNKLQAVVLFGMLWTLFIWVISILSLICSIVLYLLFLWHHIPADDGSLGKYCRNKINRRMERIVKVKTDKALKKENEIRARQEAQAARDGISMRKQPTLPDLEAANMDGMPGLSRQTTMTTLPEYSSRPQTGQNSDDNLGTLPTLPDLQSSGRPYPNRSMTHTSEMSWSSYSSNAPLMTSAGDMGYSPSDHAQTPISNAPGSWGARPGPTRNPTNGSQSSQRGFGPGIARPGTAQSGRMTPASYQMEPISRPGTAASTGTRPRYPSDMDSMPTLPEGQDNSFRPQISTDLPPNPSRNFSSPVYSQGRRTPSDSTNPYFPSNSEQGRNSPAPHPSRPYTPSRGLPERSFTSPIERSFTPAGPPPRTMTPGGIPPRTMTPSGPSYRSMTPAGQAPFTRVQTSGNMNDSNGYNGYNQSSRSMSPQSRLPPNQSYAAFDTASGHPDRQNVSGGYYQRSNLARDSGVDDILNHY